MKNHRILILLVALLSLSGFNFASSENAPQDCKYMDAKKTRIGFAKYVTKTTEIVGWYVCQGENENLNDIQIAELPANANMRDFRVKYIKENVNDAAKARYSTLSNFSGAQVLRGAVRQSTNQHPMFVDFYILRKKDKTYVLIYKDNEERYKRTKTHSRAVIAELLQKIK